MVERCGHKGFTLIEVLTAMMILTISMVTIFHLFSDGLRAAKISNGYTRAIFHARAKMEEVLLADRLREGESDGVIEPGYRWHLSIVPMEEDLDSNNDDVNPSTKLFRISVDVIWDNGGHEKNFSLSTLLLAEMLSEDENA